jgi:hypothetical protein
MLNQMHPIHNFPTYFPQIHSKILFQSTPRSSEWSLYSSSPTKILNSFLICPMHATCPSHLIIYDFVTRILFCEAYKL